MSNVKAPMTNEIPNSPVGSLPALWRESARQLAHFQPAGVIPMLNDCVLPTFEMGIELDIGALTFDIGILMRSESHWVSNLRSGRFLTNYFFLNEKVVNKYRILFIL
jgi:hypothetical protein